MQLTRDQWKRMIGRLGQYTESGVTVPVRVLDAGQDGNLWHLTLAPASAEGRRMFDQRFRVSGDVSVLICRQIQGGPLYKKGVRWQICCSVSPWELALGRSDSRRAGR